MKNLSFYLLLFIIFFVFAIFVPKIVIGDARDINSEDISCAKQEAYIFLDNPLQRILTVEIAVFRKTQQAMYINAYTLFGIKYAVVEVVCGGNGRLIWDIT